MQNNKPQYTLVAFEQEALDKVYKGVRLVTKAVETTLGPRGRNVLIDKGYETSIIADGVNVSLAINPKDPFERNGANIIKEVLKKQVQDVGDGTTVSAILAQAIIDESKKVIASGINPMSLRSELEDAQDIVLRELNKHITPANTKQDLIAVATISSQDKQLGELIGETITKLGEAGVLTVDQSKASETTVDFQKGMQIDKGLAHQFFITDPIRNLAVVEETHVLVTDIPLIESSVIASYLENIVFPQGIKKLLIIAPEIGGDFLTVLAGAKQSGQFLAIPVRAPSFGTNQINILQDIAILTGSTLITKEAGMSFEELTDTSVLGKASRVIASQTSTTIESSYALKEDISSRIAHIKQQIESSDLTDYELEQLKARLAKLTSGVATIKVGGQTEVEMKERMERAIDAVCSTTNARATGIVAGGETIYLKLHEILDESILGHKILKYALLAPFNKLVSNAGLDAGGLVQFYQTNNKSKNFGFNVVKNEWEADLVKVGIIDSAGVPINAIKNAVSVANQLISLDCAIVIENE